MGIDLKMIKAGIKAAVLLLLFGACGQSTGCSGCESEDGAIFPIKDRIHNAAQLRITRSGLSFLEENLEPLLAAALPEGGLNICLPGESGNTIGIDYGYCHQDMCDGGGLGCQLNIAIGGVDLTAEAPNVVRASIEFDALSARIPIEASPIAECSILIDGSGFNVEFPLTLLTPEPERFLSFELTENPQYQLSDIDVRFEGEGGLLGWVCDGISLVINLPFIRDLIFDGIQGFVDGLLADQIRGFVEDFTCSSCETDLACPANLGATCQDGQCLFPNGRCVPAKIGLDSELDVGSALSTVTPGLDAVVNYLAAVGSYAEVENGGISMGLVAGAVSRRNRCVPLVVQPEIVEPARSDLLRGNMDLMEQDYHLGLGVTREMIEHFSWAFFNAGSLCVQVTNDTVEQLNAGILSIVLPDLANLARNPEAPVAITLAPQNEPVITFGNNEFMTDEEGASVLVDPAMVISIPELWLDFHVFMDDRWVRIFSLHADVELPIGLDFTPNNEIIPIIGDLSEGLNNVRTANGGIMRDDPELLGTLLPAILSIFVGDLVGGVIEPIALPDLLGFRLDMQDGAIRSIEEGALLAFFVRLAAASEEPEAEMMPDAEMGAMEGALTGGMVETRINEALVQLPDPGSRTQGGLHRWRETKVFLEIEAGDGRADPGPMEVSWRVDGATWSPFQPAGTIIAQHPMFILEGRYRLEARARRVGDYRSLDLSPDTIEVVIDSRPPVVELLEDQGRVEIVAEDLVSDAAALIVEYRVGTTSWVRLSESSSIDWDDTHELIVRVTDEAGHQTSARLAARQAGLIGRPAPDARGQSGCDCHQFGGTSGGSNWWLLLIGVGLWRRRRVLYPALLAGALLGLIGCDDSSGAQKDLDSDMGSSVELCDPAEACEAPNEACVDGRCGLVDCRRDSTACDQLVCENGAGRCNERGLCECEPFCPEGCGAGTYCCMSENRCVDQPEGCRDLACSPGQNRIVELTDEGDPLVCGDEEFECVCEEQAPIALGTIGRFNDLAVVGDVAWVAAYSDTYGDLVVGRYTRVDGFTWQWVDGVPENGTITANETGPRGGTTDSGPDVGRYTALAHGGAGILHVAYYDVDNGALKYALGLPNETGHAWTVMTLDDVGDAGRWASISLDEENRPGIAYRVGSLEGASQVRYIQATNAQPGNPEAWGAPLVLQSRELDDPDPNTGTYPEGTGLFTSQSRTPDGHAVVAWYDRSQGALWWSRMNGAGFDEPEMLAGWGHPDPDRDGDMGANVDLKIDIDGQAHLCFQDGLTDSLRYLAPGLDRDEWVDDGVWLDVGGRGHSVHVVGEDCNIVLDRNGRPAIVYQDSTMQALLLRRRDTVTPDLVDGWGRRRALRGDGGEAMGSFGFYTSAQTSGNQLWIIHFVYRNHLDDPAHGLELLTVEL